MYDPTTKQLVWTGTATKAMPQYRSAKTEEAAKLNEDATRAFE